MTLYRSEAVVLRSRKYLEADSLLTLFTKKRGKVGAIAKGVRKPNSRLRGGVQVFTHNDMLLHQGRNLDIITQSQCLEAFTLLQEDIRAMTAACYWSELIDSLVPEGESDPQLFQLVLAGFHILCLSSNEPVIRGLEIKLLSFLGYRPFLEKCVTCGKLVAESSQVTFSVKHGGVLCAACSKDQAATTPSPFSLEALGVWQQLMKMDLSKIGRLKVSPQALGFLDRVTEEFLLRQLDYPLKSRPILKQMLQATQE